MKKLRNGLMLQVRVIIVVHMNNTQKIFDHISFNSFIIGGEILAQFHQYPYV